MSERIIYYPEGEFNAWADAREFIVRCRDCKCSIESSAWPGAMECWYIGRGVEPDGFCAWGERKDA